jgi:hypothetical protein
MISRRGATLACAALALFAALPCLGNDFSLDAYLVLDDPRVRGFVLHGLFTTPWGGGAGGAAHAGVNAGYYRPLTELLYLIEWRVFCDRALGWHAVSAALHIACTLLGLSLARRLTRDEAASIAAAAIFALHPVHTEAITVVAYQTTLLSACLALAALACFGRFLDGRGTGHALAAALLTACALAAKEEAAALPALALAWAIVERPPSWRRSLLAVAVMIVAEAGVLALRGVVVTALSVSYFAGQPPSTVVFTMLGVVGLYAELLVAPLRLCHFYDWFIVPFSTSIDGGVIRGVACLAGLGLGFVIALRRHRPLAIALAWLALALLPMMQLLPMLNVAAERFLYLPSLGYALALGIVGSSLGRRAPRATYLAGLMLLSLFALRGALRMRDFHDDRSLLEAEARDFAETPTPLLYLADLDVKSGDLIAARAHLEEALRRAPGWPVAEERLRRLPAR